MQQIALVTGAARNIGKGIARTLLETGYDCILVDVDEAALRETTDELTIKGGVCHPYTADISSCEQVEKLLTWLEDGNLSVTALVNNAAYESPVSVAEITPTELAKSSKTNLEGPFYMSSLFAKTWKEKHIKGNIVFISSTHSHVIRTHPLYSASKAAIEMFVKEAALELAESGTRVNAVAPGPTQDTPELKADYRVPLGFYQQPQDIGEAVAFLLSEKARFITGQSLVVDGGFSLVHTHHWLKNGSLPRP